MAANIVKKCIGADFEEDLSKQLENATFSVLIDESSELLGAERYLAILVRFLDLKNLFQSLNLSE